MPAGPVNAESRIPRSEKTTRKSTLRRTGPFPHRSGEPFIYHPEVHGCRLRSPSGSLR